MAREDNHAEGPSDSEDNHAKGPSDRGGDQDEDADGCGVCATVKNKDADDCSVRGTVKAARTTEAEATCFQKEE